MQERPDPDIPGRAGRYPRARGGLNFADTMARVGLYPDAPKLPAVVGYEVAGVRADTGERVIAGTHFGGYQSRVVVAEEDVVALPERLSFEQGAAIPVNYATAGPPPKFTSSCASGPSFRRSYDLLTPAGG